MNKKLVFAVIAVFTIALGMAALVTPAMAHDTTIVCHKPGTQGERTLVVRNGALPGHLAHGDTIGLCNA
ncbi:MAG: hypothetical protein ACE5J2_08990 [Nitrososphaerales archaeon]